jgi:hypothetical protein
MLNNIPEVLIKHPVPVQEFDIDTANSIIQPTSTILPGTTDVLLIKGLLAINEVQALLSAVPDSKFVTADSHGVAGNNQKTGSYRASLWAPNFASILFERIRPFISNPLIVNPFTPTDAHDTIAWSPVSINPLLRLIHYKSSGTLIPHYDGPVFFQDGTRTLYSVIIGLTSDSSGATRFLSDPKRDLPFTRRSHGDQDRIPEPNDVDAIIVLEPTDALIFPHRILHDTAPVNLNKTILRTDVIYTRISL